MRVLQVIDSLPLAGAEVIVWQLSLALREAGIESEIYALQRIGSLLETECERAGLTVHYSPVKSLYSLRQIAEIRKYTAALHYDVVHVHLFPAQLWVAMARALGRWKSPLVTTEHSTENRRRNLLFRAMDRWMYGRYDKVVTVSEAASTSLQRWAQASSEHVAIIHNGVRLSEIAKTEICDLKSQLGIRGQFLAITVGRCQPIKNQHCLIRAMSRVKDVHLAIVGDGVLLPELRALAESLQLSGRVHFLGRRKEVISLLKGADIYVQASRWEGFGIAAVEAMAVGLPLAISNVPGLRDVVAKAALTFESDDDAQLAVCIEKLKSDPALRATLAAAGRARALDFDLSKTTQAYAELYRSLLAKSEPAC
jgi:glycosyltransferase involved in cell wall biosynthesis